MTDETTRDILRSISGLIPEKHDSIDFTYVAAGNGAGEIETATFNQDGVAVVTLTLTYNSDNKISNVTSV